MSSSETLEASVLSDSIRKADLVGILVIDIYNGVLLQVFL